MKTKKEALIKAIENVYDMFAKYSCQRNISLCSCCHEAHDLDKVMNTSLKELTDEDLWIYQSAVKGNITVETVKHFIPRYIESISLHNFSAIYNPLEFMNTLDPDDWKDGEIEVIEAFGYKLFDYFLSLNPNPINDEYLLLNIMEMFKYLEKFDIKKLLDIWMEEESYTAVLHFNELYSLYWCASKQVCKQLKNDVLNEWLASSKTREHFSQKIEDIILLETQKVSEKDLETLNLFYEYYLFERD